MGTSEAKGVAAEHLQVTRRSLVLGLAFGSVAAVRSPHCDTTSQGDR
jgi:hypothetical protein